MANGSYSWLTLSTAVSQLAQRLADPTMQFWQYNELVLYLQQSLRQYNSMVWAWRQDFTFVNPGPTNVWSNLGSIAGSPRQRTITDLQVYAELEYMLLESSNTTGTWTGTTQFTITDLSQALQRRRDEMIQISNCNQVLLSGIPLTPGTRRTELPDSVIDVERVRYLTAPIGATGWGDGGWGDNGWGGLSGTSQTIVTLVRDDTIANEFYEVPLWQFQESVPQTFALSAQPPLSWDVDYPPAAPGTYEAVVLQSGAPFNPPTATLVGLPDDWIWILEYGALADLLGSESEKTDHERADFCMRRYQDGLKLIQKTPWIELGKVNGVAVSCDSIVNLDRFDPNWDSYPNTFGPVIVTGGTDFIASPVGASTGCTLLANAPFLDSTNTWVQVSRSDADIMFDLAQARAAFKQGSIKEVLELEKRALEACALENTRLRSLGAFSDLLVQRGQSQERSMNRYNSKQKA